MLRAHPRCFLRRYGAATGSTSPPTRPVTASLYGASNGDPKGPVVLAWKLAPVPPDSGSGALSCYSVRAREAIPEESSSIGREQRLHLSAPPSLRRQHIRAAAFGARRRQSRLRPPKARWK